MSQDEEKKCCDKPEEGKEQAQPCTTEQTKESEGEVKQEPCKTQEPCEAPPEQKQE